MTKEEEKYTTLDVEQCKWWVNTLFNIAKEKACNSHNFDDGEEIQSAQDKIIKALEHDTPMKVNIREWIYTNCPNRCGYELSTHQGDGYYSIDKKPTFCPKCGQRLDWGCDND
jgi:hypothetical protein